MLEDEADLAFVVFSLSFGGALGAGVGAREFSRRGRGRAKTETGFPGEVLVIEVRRFNEI